jgi:hypothetical protein
VALEGREVACVCKDTPTSSIGGADGLRMSG